MDKLLVTGGCGFIGGHVVSRLIELGHEVTVLDNLDSGTLKRLHPKARFVQADVNDSDLLRDILPGMDYCIHLAAIASVSRCDDDRLTAHRCNYLALLALFDCIASQKLHTKIIYASSAAVYGPLESRQRLTEKQRPHPISLYGADKFACEILAQTLMRTHNIPSVGLRFFNVFGQGLRLNDEYAGVITRFAHAIQNNQAITLFGDGKQTRDFVYIDDVVESILCAMKQHSDTQNVFNVCSGTAVSIEQLAHTMMSLLDTQVPIHRAPARPQDIRHSLGSYELIQQIMDWSPLYDIKTGLQHLFTQ